MITCGYDNDQLHGDAGSDQLYGGAGDDQLSGGTGDDLLSGEYGDDNYFFAQGDGKDVISDTLGHSTIYLSGRSEEHTSELQSPMRISYAVFYLKKQMKTTSNTIS